VSRNIVSAVPRRRCPRRRTPRVASGDELPRTCRHLAPRPSDHL